MKKHLPLLAVSVFLTACAVSAKNDGVMKAQERSGGLFGLSTKDDVEVNSAGAFEGKQQVVIGGFKVGFNESKKLQNKASGGLFGGGFGGKSTGLVKLENVSDSTRQQITDAIYNDFVANLQANGYSVVARSNFTSSKAYEGTKEYDFPYENDDSGFLSSYGVAQYYSPSAIGNKQPIFMGEIDGVTGGFGFANPMNGAGEYSESTGVAVLNVTYFVDFAGAGGHAGITSSSLEVGQLLAVDSGTLGITGGASGSFSSNVGTLTLGQPIASDKEFATIVNNSSDVSVGIETATNIASALLGGGTNQSREFVFNANEQKYADAAVDALRKANKTFVGKMVSLR